jgi:hypothetical protein
VDLHDAGKHNAIAELGELFSVSRATVYCAAPNTPGHYRRGMNLHPLVTRS